MEAVDAKTEAAGSRNPQARATAEVVDGSDKGRTNRRGNVNLDFAFDGFGIYQINLTASKNGFRTVKGSLRFSVQDRTDGRCDIQR